MENASFLTAFKETENQVFNIFPGQHQGTDPIYGIVHWVVLWLSNV